MEDFSDSSNMDWEEDDMFDEVYKCYPVSFIGKSNLENGGKIIMPPSVLRSLVSLDMEFPVLFELTNPSAGRVTNCGVQEFTADEGIIYMPEWMMENMRLKVGDYMTLRSTSLPSGTYLKLQPHTKDFLDVSDPKSILEYSLRSYSCLTTGDTIMIAYNNKKYYIDIVETKPSSAISIIETDCEVDFAQPLDYKEPEKELSPPLPDNGPNEVQDNSETKTAGIIPFTGSARRLDGQPSTQSAEESPFSMLKQQPTENETKNSNSKPSRTSGKLVFGTNAPKIQTPPKASLESTPQESSSEEKPKFEAFTGKKYSLKD